MKPIDPASLVYAIDFGTSNSILGAADVHGTRGFAPLDSKSTIIRSLLYFASRDQVFFGSEAIQEFAARDQVGRLIRSIKKQLPSRSFVGTFVDNRPFNLEDLIAVFLGELRKRANTFYKAEVTRVVLGRPARFAADDLDDQYAERRLRKAAELAGFTQIEFFPEPIAAAFGYAQSSDTLGAQKNKAEIVLAADYGGGTSDFTVYQIGAQSQSSLRSFSPSDVIAMGGVAVAGDSLDAALMRYRISPHFGTGVRYKVPFGSNVLTMPLHLMERICHPAEVSLLRRQDTYEFLKSVKQWSLHDEDREKMDRLFTLINDQLGFSIFEKVEATKKALSDSKSAIFEYEYPDISIQESITREEFETYTTPTRLAVEKSLDETLKAAQIDVSKIDRVLCTGGTARVPFVRKTLIDRLGPTKLHDLDPFTGVASGLMERAFEVAKAL